MEGQTEDQNEGTEGPKLVMFVQNSSGSPLKLKANWFGGDTKWDGKPQKIIKERESLTFCAEQQMGGIVSYVCFGESVIVGFQSDRCPQLEEGALPTCNGIAPEIISEWMELHRKNPNKSFVNILGKKQHSIDVWVKTFGTGVSLVSKMWIEAKSLAKVDAEDPLVTRRASATSIPSPTSSADHVSDAEPLGAENTSPKEAGRVKKRDKLLRAFRRIRDSKGSDPALVPVPSSRITVAGEQSQPSESMASNEKPVEVDADNIKFFDRAKAMLALGLGGKSQEKIEATLLKIDQNRELGKKKRGEAKDVFEEIVKHPIKVDRFRKWSDRQKTAFGQMVAMCLAKLFKRDVANLGNYPAVQKQLTENLAQRHKDLLTALLSIMTVTPDLLQGVVQQYEVMHNTTSADIPAASIFLEPIKISTNAEKCTLLRDLTALLLASGNFDTRVVAFLKLLALEIDIIPESIDEWASDAGKNLWETYHSQKGDKESSVSPWKVGLCVAAGGVALGATGGLALIAAPAALGAVGTAIGGGVTAVASALGLQAAGVAAATAVTGVFTTTAAFVAAVGPVGGLFLFGGTGMGLTGYKLANRWGDLSNFDFVPVRPSANIVSITVWKDVMIEQIDLHMQDGTVITYGCHSEEAEAGTLEFAPSKPDEDPQEYIVAITCTAAGNADTNALCESIKLKTNKNRTKRFAGSSYSRLGLLRRKAFRFVAKDGHGIVGFDFHHGKCFRVYSTTVTSNKDEGMGAVNWTLFVSGWVPSQSDFRSPWMKVREFFPLSDHFCLEWENEKVIRLGHFLGDRIRSEIGEFAARAWVKSTVVAVGGGAIVWPWFVTKSLVDLDNDWIIVMERAKLAGRCLATVLDDAQAIGNRPVTLSGHSMGALVIFHCLLELYELKKFHVVKDVILLGSPIPLSGTSVSLDTEIWAKARSVVSGRFVNAYTGGDWLLAFLFRYMEWTLFVAGLQPIDGVPGIENVDVSTIVSSHEDYPKKYELIMHYCGFH